MTYRFSNDNFLAVYESPALGKFTLIIREIRDDLWEVDISCGNEAQVLGADRQIHAFPSRRTVQQRDQGLMLAKELFRMDPQTRLREIHDGKSRVSVHFGDFVSPGVPMSGETLLSSKDATTYGITRLEVWEDDVVDS